MSFVRDAYRAVVRVVIFQSCRAFLIGFLREHRLASPKAAHQVHTIDQADEHAVHTNPPPACAVASHRDGIAHPRGIASGGNETRLHARARGQGTGNLDFFRSDARSILAIIMNNIGTAKRVGAAAAVILGLVAAVQPTTAETRGGFGGGFHGSGLGGFHGGGFGGYRHGFGRGWWGGYGGGWYGGFYPGYYGWGYGYYPYAYYPYSYYPYTYPYGYYGYGY